MTMNAHRLMDAIIRLGDIGRKSIMMRTIIALMCMVDIIIAGSERVNWLLASVVPLRVVLVVMIALPIFNAVKVMSLGLRAAFNVRKYGVDPTPAFGLFSMYACDMAACVFMILLLLRGPSPAFPGMF